MSYQSQRMSLPCKFVLLILGWALIAGCAHANRGHHNGAMADPTGVSGQLYAGLIIFFPGEIRFFPAGVKGVDPKLGWTVGRTNLRGINGYLYYLRCQGFIKPVGPAFRSVSGELIQPQELQIKHIDYFGSDFPN